MPGSVIRRVSTRIEGDLIVHDDQPAKWADADALAGRRLDRRRCYAIIPNAEYGDLCELVRWTDDCSGCTEHGDYGTKYGPMGCSECGYTGRSRREEWVPMPGQIRRAAA